MRQVKIILALCSICVVGSACSSLEYVPNTSLRQMQGITHEEYKTATSYPGSPRQYGAFRVLRGEDPAREEEEYGPIPQGTQLNTTADNGRMFVLRRQKAHYSAETLLSDKSMDERSWYDRSYVAFGADRKKKSLGFRLRFEY